MIPETSGTRFLPMAMETLILEPEDFYILCSAESVSIPPELAAEMAAYEASSGELRTHYAGFFDPGFGYGEDGRLGRSSTRPGSPRARRSLYDLSRPKGRDPVV